MYKCTTIDVEQISGTLPKGFTLSKLRRSWMYQTEFYRVTGNKIEDIGSKKTYYYCADDRSIDLGGFKEHPWGYCSARAEKQR